MKYVCITGENWVDFSDDSPSIGPKKHEIVSLIEKTTRENRNLFVFKEYPEDEYPQECFRPVDYAFADNLLEKISEDMEGVTEEYSKLWTEKPSKETRCKN